MFNSKKLARYITLYIAGLLFFCARTLATPSDQYIEGYIQSLFIHDYALPKDAVEMRNGVIYIDEEKINGQNPTSLVDKVTQACLTIECAKPVELKIKHEDYSKTSDKSTTTHNNRYNRSKKIELDGALPNHPLFDPLIADPKWPRFTVAYHYYLKDGSLKQAFSPNFGASFGLYRLKDEARNMEWEIGVQAGLFGLMDIGANPSALINADYFVSLPISYRSGSWSGLIRPYHISAHLGDEHMLTAEGKKTKRINLSYEGIDLIFSYDFPKPRLYLGGGYIINKEPSYYKRLKVQGGAEYYSDTTFLNGRIRPVAGVDIKAEENGKWHPGISCKAGFQLENSLSLSNKVQLMLEFYSGKSIHGQFYKKEVRYLGIGLHAFL